MATQKNRFNFTKKIYENYHFSLNFTKELTRSFSYKKLRWFFWAPKTHVWTDKMIKKKICSKNSLTWTYGNGKANHQIPGRVARLVTCLATDASLTADPGVMSSIPAWFHTFVGIDCSWNNFYGHSPPFRWIIQEGLLSVTSEGMCTKYWLTASSSWPRKKVVRWTDRPAMTIAVDLGRNFT